ncbi:permease [Desulfolithobacter sp.]
MTGKKNGSRTRLRGIPFFLLVAVAYAILFWHDQNQALLALYRARAILLRILPVFAVVILFTGLVNYLLRPGQIVKHLGAGSGLRGWIIALIAGVISHGPMYAWYPMIEDLRKQGTRDGLIVAFFYARAIKVPFLPLMIDYFGSGFTLVLSCYILLGAFVQGWIMELLSGSGPRTG